MQSSLDKLASNLDSFPETLKYVKKLTINSLNTDDLSEILQEFPTDLDDFADHDEVDVFNIDHIDDYREHPDTKDFSEEQRDRVNNRMKLITYP